MKSKIKKTLIIISSAIVLFLGVFFMTRSLNDLLEGSKKDNNISIEDNSSNTASDNKSDNLANESAQNDNKNGNEPIANNSEESDKTQVTNSQSTDKYTDYIVKEGDTLFSIARNTMPWKSQEEAVKILETMNSLKNREVISVGTKLMVPVNTIDTSNTTKYTVQEGESLYTIAEEYLPDMNVAQAVDMIMKKNNISNPNLISVGLEIYIPNGDSSSVNSSSVETKKTSEADEDLDSRDTLNENTETELSDEERDDQ